MLLKTNSAGSLTNVNKKDYDAESHLGNPTVNMRISILSILKIGVTGTVVSYNKTLWRSVSSFGRFRTQNSLAAAGNLYATPCSEYNTYHMYCSVCLYLQTK